MLLVVRLRPQGLWILALACIGLRAAHAETPAERAVTLFEQARSRFDAGDYDAARSLLSEAAELHDSPLILERLADCLERLDRPEEALTALERIERPPAAIVARTRALRSELLRPVPVLVVTTGGVAATVEANGTTAEAPARLLLPRGRHTVTVRAPAHKPRQVELDVRGTREKTVTIALEALLGRLVVTSSALSLDGVEVRVDGERLAATAETATDPLETIAGTHLVACHHPDGRTWAGTVHVEPDRETTVMCLFEAPRSANIAFWTTLGTGTAATIVGAALLIVRANAEETKAADPSLDVHAPDPAAGWTLVGLGAAALVATPFLWEPHLWE